MDKKQTVHFIGIGGAGMSALSEVFYCHGYNVQGSDIKKTKVTDRLNDLGISIYGFHSAKNIKGADFIVYSSCIAEDNVERKFAMQNKIPILQRIEAMNMLMANKNLVAVSGTHGKTTTTSLISFLLIKGGLDPTVFIGADVPFLNGGARYGQSDLVITEADESDGSFLLINPLYSVITNVDKEHMDYYSSMDDVKAAYRSFIENTKDRGSTFVCIDDYNLRKITEKVSKKIVKYGLSQDAYIRAVDIELLGLDGSKFKLMVDNKLLGEIELSLIGRHNILNSLACIGIAMELGMDFSSIKKVISGFKGADRRFSVTHLPSDIILIDDYAHHPTEIEATLKVLEDSSRRIIAVFQPHRFSRTKYLKEEYGSCFGAVDYLVITDIYSAHEGHIDGISALDICESVKLSGHENVNFVSRYDIIKHLKDVVRPKDAVFILGAGDIGELPKKIVKLFNKPQRAQSTQRKK